MLTIAFLIFNFLLATLLIRLLRSEVSKGAAPEPVRIYAVDEEYQEAIRREARYFRAHPDEWTGLGANSRPR